jgi:hypothetical protein
LPATFYVVRRISHLFFSHSTLGACFLDALRHQRDGNHEEIAQSLLKEPSAALVVTANCQMKIMRCEVRA